MLRLVIEREMNDSFVPGTDFTVLLLQLVSTHKYVSILKYQSHTVNIAKYQSIEIRISKYQNIATSIAKY